MPGVGERTPASQVTVVVVLTFSMVSVPPSLVTV